MWESIRIGESAVREVTVVFPPSGPGGTHCIISVARMLPSNLMEISTTVAASRVLMDSNSRVLMEITWVVQLEVHRKGKIRLTAMA